MSKTDHHHWLTLHRFRFDGPVAARTHTFSVPGQADCWRFAPSQVMGENNLPTWVSDVWGGMGIYESRAAAEEVLADPVAQIAPQAETAESWHALAIPVQHRGAVNWRGSVEENGALRSSDDDPGGPLAVLTTAGFNSRDSAELPRISRFAVKVMEALGYLSDQPGNLRSSVFNGGFDGKEGFTLTLWTDNDVMTKAAYASGHHRSLMDESRDGSLFDRSSFSRARILSEQGSWEGPVCSPPGLTGCC